MKKNENTILGLLVRGSIVARTKKEIQAKNETVEVVTYTIATESTRRLYVEDYSPDSYFEIGENVELPVYVKAISKEKWHVILYVQYSKGIQIKWNFFLINPRIRVQK